MSIIFIYNILERLVYYLKMVQAKYFISTFNLIYFLIQHIAFYPLITRGNALQKYKCLKMLKVCYYSV